MSAALVKPPTRGELEALSLSDRVALEDVLGEAHEFVREMNDAEIAMLVVAGQSLSTLATLTGLTKQGVAYRLDRLGLQTVGQREQGSRTSPPLPQNGDGPEVVDAEVVEAAPASPRVPAPERPAHYLPDVVSEDALTNLRTQALHWYEQGRVIDELLDDGAALEARSKDDRAALKRETAEMVRIARRLKGAV